MRARKLAHTLTNTLSLSPCHTIGKNIKTQWENRWPACGSSPWMRAPKESSSLTSGLFIQVKMRLRWASSVSFAPIRTHSLAHAHTLIHSFRLVFLLHRSKLDTIVDGNSIFRSLPIGSDVVFRSTKWAQFVGLHRLTDTVIFLLLNKIHIHIPTHRTH